MSWLDAYLTRMTDAETGWLQEAAQQDLLNSDGKDDNAWEIWTSATRATENT